MTPEQIRDTLEQSESLLRAWRPPWDEHDATSIHDLHGIAEMQQRALVELLEMVESERKIGQVHRGRVDALEMVS